MTQRPQKPFNLHADPENDILRDKDNAHPRHEPKVERKPAPNLAPAGAKGIQLGLPSNQNKSKPAKRFVLGKTGNLNKEFKFVAREPSGKGKTHDRGR